MAGEVVSITTLEGQTINANQQAPADRRDQHHDGLVASLGGGHRDVKPGQDVYFTVLGGSRRWNSKVRQILPYQQRGVL